MATYLKSLIEQAVTQGYKSNVIKPLLGMMIIFTLGAMGTSYLKIPIIPYVFFGLISICGIGMLFAYFYCLFKNPDLLRSEKYNLEKSAIEKVAISGDSETKAAINMPYSDYIMVEGKNNKKIEDGN